MALLIVFAIVVTGFVVGTRFSALTGQIAVNHRALEDLRKQQAEGQTIVGQLDSRLSTLEAKQATETTPSDVARRALRSVFTIESGVWPDQVLGSAFVLRSNAASSLMVTNYHVVRNTWEVGGRTVSVKQDAGTYSGTIEAVNAEKDLAVVRVPVSFAPLPVSDSRPAPGDSVLVIGSPYGLEGSVATGVVSGFRSGYLQFSAPVSPGDSGAPVLDEHGEVVGVVVAKVSAPGAEGLSFAVPVDVLCATLVGCG